MSPACIRAVVDTLMPGDAGASLPSATAAGVNPARYETTHRVVLDAIAAGDEAAFLAASGAARAEALSAVERRLPLAFRALVLAVLQDYYEAPAVIAALGWRADPPQPKGHAFVETDRATWQRLERVKRRGRLWR